jgi:hypothetical protein
MLAYFAAVDRIGLDKRFFVVNFVYLFISVVYWLIFYCFLHTFYNVELLVLNFAAILTQKAL